MPPKEKESFISTNEEHVIRLQSIISRLGLRGVTPNLLGEKIRIFSFNKDDDENIMKINNSRELIPGSQTPGLEREDKAFIKSALKVYLNLRKAYFQERIISVPQGCFAISANADRMLFTDGLGPCVGLALQAQGKIGLGHFDSVTTSEEFTSQCIGRLLALFGNPSTDAVRAIIAIGEDRGESERLSSILETSLRQNRVTNILRCESSNASVCLNHDFVIIDVNARISSNTAELAASREMPGARAFNFPQDKTARLFSLKEGLVVEQDLTKPVQVTPERVHMNVPIIATSDHGGTATIQLQAENKLPEREPSSFASRMVRLASAIDGQRVAGGGLTAHEASLIVHMHRQLNARRGEFLTPSESTPSTGLMSPQPKDVSPPRPKTPGRL